MDTVTTPINGSEAERFSGAMRALAGFYEAFNSRDLSKIAKNWAHTSDAVMDNPVGGVKRGWDEIRSVYEKIFGGPAVVQVEFYDYSFHEAGDIAYFVGRERGTLRSGDQNLQLAIRTTRIFRKIDGEWRQVHHHGSFEDGKSLARYQEILRAERKAA